MSSERLTKKASVKFLFNSGCFVFFNANKLHINTSGGRSTTTVQKLTKEQLRFMIFLHFKASCNQP